MSNSSLSERFDVVEELQKLRAHHEVGTYQHERADHAIDLALSPRRKVDAFFKDDLLRDSGRILRRKWASDQGKFMSFDVSPGGCEDVLLLEAILPLVPDPAESLLAGELAIQIRTCLSDSAPAMAVFDGLIRGDSIAELACQHEISVSYAKALRARIRTETRHLLSKFNNIQTN